ncbi:MAG TPA: UvrD-helicase domain-containing protein [Candidatus Babeliales bacterium]|jgi:DNA helicase-2/ATP-dependent DNA helicase PcrA|nr:UvrD-helicase domain-containing protein [Candidatus Babeliales bacterium]
MRDSFNNFLHNNLNNAQQKAVTHEAGSILVVAGAGSGKTRVITARITHLILNKNVAPSSIVALTFTNKAANEMKERIASFLGDQTNLPFVGTFHSYCVQLLKRYQEYLPNPFFSILDSDDQQKMIQGILQRNGLQKQFTAKNTAYQISQMKNHTVDPSHPATEHLTHPMLADIFNAYETEKKASKTLDFDDLLLETLRLLQKNNVIKNRFQEKVRHILVDEYQDTNVVQHELLKAMALSDNALAIDSVCAVGDEDQSIYSWRGATVTNMASFKTVFPDTAIVTIEQNYRSVQPILTIANHTIQNNSCRTPKTLWSEKQGTNRISQLLCLTEYQEARAIAQLLLIAQSKYGLNNVGILYRTHTQSRALEEALLQESIPYRIIGGIQFYERKEIKDLLAYLKIIANPFDRTSFFRIINVPARGLGDKFETTFYTQWTNEPFATWRDIINQLITSGNLGKVKTAELHTFSSIFENLEPTSLTSKAVEQIIIRAGYLSYIKNNDEPQEAQARLDNIKELLDAINHFEVNGTTTITTFLDEVALMQEKMNKQNKDAHAVSLMTLHAAKGLEFDLVILPGIEEGIIPTTRSLNSHDALEEERRLFYVGITRAKEHLLITCTKHRYSYGQMIDQLPSRFLREIPAHLIPQEDIAYASLTQIKQFCSHWLKFSCANASENEKSDIYIPTFVKPSSSTQAAEQTSEDKSKNKMWKKNQPVKHAKYGVGTVQEIEEKATGDTHLTVRFKIGVKKIVAQFVQRL